MTHEYDFGGCNLGDGGVPAAEGGALLGWRSPALAPISLRLITPRLLIEGLRYLGLAWEPEPFEEVGSDDQRPGMYTWVDGIDLSRDAVDRAVLYTGIGMNARYRVVKESSWKTGDHAHGRMLARRNACALLGSVTGSGTPDLSFLHELSERHLLKEEGIAIVHDWVERVSPLRQAEEFSIRLSIHLGDTVSPVNSQFAGAWNTQRPADWAAFAVAAWMALEA
nr:hypothetical protein [Rhodococcus sp. (in: high G+C Gram-positive bacteria)]